MAAAREVKGNAEQKDGSYIKKFKTWKEFEHYKISKYDSQSLNNPTFRDVAKGIFAKYLWDVFLKIKSPEKLRDIIYIANKVNDKIQKETSNSIHASFSYIAEDARVTITQWYKEQEGLLKDALTENNNYFRGVVLKAGTFEDTLGKILKNFYTEVCKFLSEDRELLSLEAIGNNSSQRLGM